MAFCNFNGNPKVYKTRLRCYIISPLQLTGAKISAQRFQISSCCFPLDFLEFSCAFKGQPRIWGKFIHWFGDSFPLVLSFPGISLSIYSSSGSLNSVLWHPNLIKQQIFAWIIAALCHMNWKMPLGKSQINVDLTQCH